MMDNGAKLTGYLQTGDETSITRKGNAREIIKTLSKERVTQYLKACLTAGRKLL